MNFKDVAFESAKFGLIGGASAFLAGQRPLQTACVFAGAIAIYDLFLHLAKASAYKNSNSLSDQDLLQKAALQVTACVASYRIGEFFLKYSFGELRATVPLAAAVTIILARY